MTEGSVLDQAGAMEAKGGMVGGGGASESKTEVHSSVKEHSSSAPNGVTTMETNLQKLISNCRAALAVYDKLYFEFEVVASKEDIDKKGQARVKVAAGDLSKQALKLSRFCMEKLTTLSVACLDEAKTAFFECKWEREFAKDPCPQMSFSGRQLTGEWEILYTSSTFKFTSQKKSLKKSKGVTVRLRKKKTARSQ